MKKKTQAIMVCGTASHVGKSVMVAALCRILRDDGLKVAPFKSQNMALNSYITKDGSEMGRAQAMQAEAAGIEPTVLMNPILLKPHQDNRGQVIIMGRVYKDMSAVEYHQYKSEALKTVKSAYRSLASDYDCIVLEGAGSPAEINLMRHDIVNLRMARMARAPVILTSDIDKGGVFASLYGTLELLPPRDRNLIKALHINKFRGDFSILKPGLGQLEKRCGKKIIGVTPYIHDIGIDEEDSVSLEDKRVDNEKKADVIIDILVLPHISNYTDFNPLERESGVRLRYIRSDKVTPDTDVLILPGTKNTAGDLKYLRSKGLEEMIHSYHKQGGLIIGICGGYQMLGKTIHDPHGVESRTGSMAGIGLLDVETTFSPEKTTSQVEALVMGVEFSPQTKICGYEIHMGNSVLGKYASPAFEIISRNNDTARTTDGAVDGEGRTLGTYIHGIFDNDIFRKNFIKYLRQKKGLSPVINEGPSTAEAKEKNYAHLAKTVRQSLDMDQLYRILQKGLD